MKNKKSIYKISGILVLLVFMLGLALAGCTAQNKTAGQTTTSQAETTTAVETTAVETQATEQLSEQPDKAKYDEYFTDFYLGKLPLGTGADPSNVPVKTAVFTSEDQFCTVWTQKKDIPAGSIAGAVYDTVAKKDFEPKTAFPMALSSGGHMGSQPLTYPPGKYEYKIYIDDVLVIVIPFEVSAGETKTSRTETTTAAEQPSEQPDKAKYDEYFTDFYLGKLPRGQQFGPYLGGKQFDPDNMPVKTAVFIASEDEFCGVGILKKGIPSGSFYVAVYDTVTKKDSIPKTAVFPVALNAGDFGWADDPINFPPGKYEYKIYVDDALVIVTPFEVR